MGGRRVFVLALVLAITNGLKDPPTSENRALGTKLFIEKEEFEYGEKISVVVDYGDESENAGDFVGLFDVNPSMMVRMTPYSVDVLGKKINATVTAKRSGTLDIRLIRPPFLTLAKTTIKIFPQCKNNCSRHGTCFKGQCVCRKPYRNEICSSLDSAGLSLSLLAENEENERGYLVGTTITVTINHDELPPSADLELGSGDYVGIFPVDSLNQSKPIDFRFVPTRSRTVTLNIPRATGEYVMRFVDGFDKVVTAQSQPFSVFHACPNHCSTHGVCIKGKCECDRLYDLDDCSRHPEMANLTVMADRDLAEGDSVQIKFWRDESLSDVFSAQDWVVLGNPNKTECTDPIAYKHAVPTRIRDPDALERRGSWVSGIVTFDSVEAGEYVVQYCRNRKVMYANMTEPLIVYPACKLNCSYPQGTCLKGECICSPNWQGSTCSSGVGEFSIDGPSEGEEVYRSKELTVRFARPVGNGSNFDFIGLFAANSVDNSDGIADWQYAIAERNKAHSHMMSGEVGLTASREGNYSIRYVDGRSMTTMAQTTVFSVYPPCPHSCSRHGNCSQGACLCEEGWDVEPDCSVHTGKVELTVKPDSIPKWKYGDAEVRVTWTRPAGLWQSGDYIAILAETAENAKLLAFGYTTTEDSGTVSILLPQTTPVGNYTIRYVPTKQRNPKIEFSTCLLTITPKI